MRPETKQEIPVLAQSDGVESGEGKSGLGGWRKIRRVVGHPRSVSNCILWLGVNGGVDKADSLRSRRAAPAGTA